MDEKEAVAIYNNIKGYKGTQLQNWNEVENKLFQTLVVFTSGFLDELGSKNGSSQVVAKQIGKDNAIKLLEKANKELPIQAQSYTEEDKLGLTQIKTSVVQYTINSFGTFLGTIREIGLNAQTNEVPYLINFTDNSLVFLARTTHYAYPIKLQGKDTDLTNYIHNYSKLMDAASNEATADVIKFITQGKCPATIDLFTVYVANYICESNRNWVQLLLDLIYLKSGDTTFKAFKANQFPMGGGGWKNQHSWGPGINIHASSSSSADGRDIKRWMLAVFMTYVSELKLKFWIEWIIRSSKSDKSFVSGKGLSQLIRKSMFDGS